MCFNIKLFYPKLVAKRDIVCYKVIDRDNRSHYYDFLYEPTKIYEMNDSLFGSWLGRIEKGYHSYVSLDDAVLSSENDYSTKIVRMTIPIGAKYYYNPDDGEYVSNKIVTGYLEDIDTMLEFNHTTPPSGFVNWFKMYILRR